MMTDQRRLPVLGILLLIAALAIDIALPAQYPAGVLFVGVMLIGFKPADWRHER